MLVQQLARELAPGPDTGGYVTAGVLGVVIFLAALLPRLLIQRLTQNEALLRRQEVDLANLAQAVAVHRGQAAREPAGRR
ncbi:MAG: hypothetical protein WDO12_02430 [Pseudomonadota bacterium]